MELIGIEEYRVYCKYGGDYSQLTDFRVGSKKDLAKITSKEWGIIEKIEDNFTSLQTGMYSKEMVRNMERIIEELKPLVSPEVLKMIEAHEKPEPLKSASWISQLLSKKQ